MGNNRGLLLIALAVVSYFIWDAWQRDYGPQAQAPAPGQQLTGSTAGDLPSTNLQDPNAASGASAGTAPDAADVPSAVPDLAAAPGTTPPVASQPSPDVVMGSLIEIETDVLRVVLNTAGGEVQSAELLDYPVSPDQPEVAYTLMTGDLSRFYVAQSGLLSNRAAPNHRSLWQSNQSSFRLGDGEDQLQVPLTWRNEEGLEVTKTFTFSRGSYEVKVSQQIRNNSDAPWAVQPYYQLQRVAPAIDDSFSLTNPERYSYNGAAYYSPEEKYEKLGYDDIAEDGLNQRITGGWAAMVQHYFFSAWVPDKDAQVQYTAQTFLPTNLPGSPLRYIIRAMTPAASAAPGGTAVTEATLYLGPKLQDDLPEVAPGLELTVDYGIFTIFSQPLFWLLKTIYKFVGNWGWAIVLLTVLIKLAFFKLTEAQYKSMAKMRKLQPRINTLRERYAGDKQRLNQEMMKIYQKEKVNPLGGCLPILIQIPIFIALYWVLLESVELRQAPFMLWIDDLSAPDPYFILPILNGAFMFMTQKLSPSPMTDPMQQKIMMSLPIVFSVMFAFFQSGLVLYWTVNSGLSLAQQWVITRRIDRADAKH